MAKAVDFEKVRRRRQLTTTLKRLFILAGVMLLIGAAVFFNQIFVEEGLTTQLSDLTESFGGTGFPAELPGGIIQSMGSLGNNLMVLNDTNLYIYNPKAKTIQNIQRMSELTIAIPSSSRVLIFAPGSKEFSVYSLSRELYSNSLGFGVICADMNERGDLAVTAPVKQFASKVTVYDKQFTEIYNWSSPEYVTDVALSPNGEMMALNCVSGEGGVLESLIYMFRFSEEKEKATVALALPDNLCLDVRFPEDDRITVLTDKRYLVLNSLGEEKHSYDFGSMRVVAVESRERQTLLLMQEQDSKTQRLVLLDTSLNEKATLALENYALDLALGKDSIYILTRSGIDVYNLNLEIKSKLTQHNISNIHLAGNRLYYLTPDEIHVLSNSELVGVSSPKSERQKR